MDRQANDVISEANTVLEVYLIDPTTRKPVSHATAPLQSALNLLVGATNAVPWTAGDGTLISLLKTVAGAAISTEPVTTVLGQDEYEACAASATTTLGVTGATGDYLAAVTVFPGSTSPGSVTIKDGSTTVATFVGGAGSVSNLVPFAIPVGAKSVSGAWSVVTGANVTAVGVGSFN